MVPASDRRIERPTEKGVDVRIPRWLLDGSTAKGEKVEPLNPPCHWLTCIRGGGPSWPPTWLSCHPRTRCYNPISPPPLTCFRGSLYGGFSLASLSLPVPTFLFTLLTLFRLSAACRQKIVQNRHFAAENLNRSNFYF